MAKKVRLEQGGQTLLPATTSDMVVHPTLKVTSDKLIGELNISTLFPTGGTDSTNKYTLETAIAKVPASLRNVGLKCSFLDEAGQLETWEFGGGSWTTGSFSQVGAKRMNEMSELEPLTLDRFCFGSVQTLKSTLIGSASFLASTEYTTLLCRVRPKPDKYRVVLEEGIAFYSYAILSSIPNEIRFNEDISPMIIKHSTRIENSVFETSEGGNYVALSVKGIPTQATYFEPVPYEEENNQKVLAIEESVSSLNQGVKDAQDSIKGIEDKIEGKKLNINSYDKKLNNAILNGTYIRASEGYILCFYHVDEREITLTASGVEGIKANFSAYLTEMPTETQLKYNIDLSAIYIQTGNFSEGEQGFTKPEGCKCLAVTFLNTATENTGITVPGSIEVSPQKIVEAITGNIPQIIPSLNGAIIPGHIFYGKKIIFIGDSLMASPRSVPPLVAQLLGLQYDDTEHALTCAGGTTTLNVYENCGMMRAREIEKFEKRPDLIIHENVNDYGLARKYKGTQEDAPFMLSKFYDVDSGKYSLENARTYFSENFSSFISGLSPTVGSMIRIGYTTQSFVFNVSSGANSAGTFAFVISGRTFGVEVSGDESAGDIVELIVMQPLNEVGCGIGSKTGNSITIVNNGDSEIVLPSFTSNSTGVNISIVENSSVNRTGYCFLSHDVSEWNTVGKWKWIGEMTMWSIYKGYFEYLMTTFPDAWVMLMITPDWYVFDWNSPDPDYTRPDGTWDWDKVKAQLDEWHYGKFNAFLREFAAYMNVPVLDLEKESSINIYNASRYYPVNNVHFNQKEEGTQRIAQAVVRCLLR